MNQKQEVSWGQSIWSRGLGQPSQLTWTSPSNAPFLLSRVSPGYSNTPPSLKFLGCDHRSTVLRMSCPQIRVCPSLLPTGVILPSLHGLKPQTKERSQSSSELGLTLAQLNQGQIPLRSIQNVHKSVQSLQGERQFPTAWCF